jgi:hypothetical protein
MPINKNNYKSRQERWRNKCNHSHTRDSSNLSSRESPKKMVPLIEHDVRVDSLNLAIKQMHNRLFKLETLVNNLQNFIENYTNDSQSESDFEYESKPPRIIIRNKEL